MADVLGWDAARFGEAGFRAVPGAVALHDARMDIVHITYQPTADQISSSDAEFSRRSISARRDAGYQDLKRALREAPWFTQDKPEALCALVHKVKDGEVTTLSATQPTTGAPSGVPPTKIAT